MSILSAWRAEQPHAADPALRASGKAAQN